MAIKKSRPDPVEGSVSGGLPSGLVWKGEVARDSKLIKQKDHVNTDSEAEDKDKNAGKVEEKTKKNLAGQADPADQERGC